MVAWTRSRVTNFGPDFARRYIGVLVALDGQPYDQAAFFHALVEAGVREDVQAEDAQDRWDAYSNKIREFGLGFVMDEQPKGGRKKTIWRASAVAKDFAAGRLDFRQFMALQCMRTQLPKPGMPLNNAESRREIERGVRIRPLALLLSALDALAERGVSAHLSQDEIRQNLTTVEQHEQLDAAVDAVIAAREGGSSGTLTSQPNLDIWINEFGHTGYIRRLRSGRGSGQTGPVVVRALPRREEARRLDELIPLQEYNTTVDTINEYLDFLCSSPSVAEREVLMLEPLVVPIGVKDGAVFHPAGPAFTGPMDALGGLVEGDKIVLVGDDLLNAARSTVFAVTEPVSIVTAPSLATVRLRPIAKRLDMQPIWLG